MYVVYEKLEGRLERLPVEHADKDTAIAYAQSCYEHEIAQGYIGAVPTFLVVFEEVIFETGYNVRKEP